MEKIIFFGLVIAIFIFVLYLGCNAIVKGMSAKNANKKDENPKSNEIENSSDVEKILSEELDKLNNLFDEFRRFKEEFLFELIEDLFRDRLSYELHAILIKFNFFLLRYVELFVF